MIRDICVNGIPFTRGVPKICVPLSGTSLDEVLWEIREVKKNPVDLLEWRMDFFCEDVLSCLRKVKEEAGETPMLLTLRSKEEGGFKRFSSKDYCYILNQLIIGGRANMVDIELCIGDEEVKKLTTLARAKGVCTVVSAHFFENTPDKEELAALFAKMEQLGADIPKIAAMPTQFSDVLTLAGVCAETAKSNYPIIAVSMGKMGRFTRLCGEEMGSCLTFASGKITSTPGQIKPALLHDILTAK